MPSTEVLPTKMEEIKRHRKHPLLVRSTPQLTEERRLPRDEQSSKIITGLPLIIAVGQISAGDTALIYCSSSRADQSRQLFISSVLGYPQLVPSEQRVQPQHSVLQ